MPPKRSRAAFTTALLATTLAAGLLTTPVHAVSGTPAADNTYAFTAKLDIGEGDSKRACSAALLNSSWLLTAASCFADNPAASLDVPAGVPALRTIATIGRTDLKTTTGQVRLVVDLRPHADQDLVLAKLASPVTDITPVALSVTAPVAGEELRVAGHGRTKDEWVLPRLHTGTFTVDSVSGTEVAITGKDGAAVCKGDTGGPAFREASGSVRLVGINTRSWQGGCLGADEAETRTSAIGTRVDTPVLAAWIRVNAILRAPGAPHDYTETGSPDLLARDSSGQLWLEDTRYDLLNKRFTGVPRRLIGPQWNSYNQIEAVGAVGGPASGGFGGTGVGDLVARDASGVLWLYQGKGDGTFATRTEIGPGWQIYQQLAGGGDLTGDGKADLVATDAAGALWLYEGTGDDPAPFAPRRKIGLAGWQHLNQLNLTGNIAGSAAGDLVARDTSGVLWLYQGKGDGTLSPPVEIGPGWNGYTHITAIGDGNVDGKPDLYAFGPNAETYFYEGTGDASALFRARSATPVLRDNWQTYNHVL
ncbi:trypsin-like serine protease [Streptomyces sp. ISL-1]|uniref:trypsin-like serine protease n=1 Tax=Streptomyces sp. ISL-1 TaxID=2817657 RepID=UPI001BE873A8|nr:trypsin-like serine protease [Streptomyces sp. ISL-1]MBT2389052.1 trypsin-like serine protease [Streptomyces sp. ISL-1]